MKFYYIQHDVDYGSYVYFAFDSFEEAKEYLYNELLNGYDKDRYFVDEERNEYDDENMLLRIKIKDRPDDKWHSDEEYEIHKSNGEIIQGGYSE